MIGKAKSRTLTTRSKTGCNTCKKRRIKCGEEQPSCARCVKSGWKCDGYGDTKTSPSVEKTGAKSLTGSAPNLFLSTPRASQEDDFAVRIATEEDNGTLEGTSQSGAKARFGSLSKNWRYESYSTLMFKSRSSSSSSSSTLGSPAAYELPFKTPGTLIERQLLHYFYVQAAPDLSGYSSHTFWNNLVLPLCHSEPAVRHATLALGALHRDYVVEGIKNPDRDQINSNALLQYNKALRQLQKYISNKELLDEKTILVCCKLFYCIEVARQDYPTALRHVRAGLVLLKEWGGRQKKRPISNMNTTSLDDVDDLVEAFCALDVQIRIFENGKPPYVVLTTPEERSGAVSCVPPTFHSLADAWNVTKKLVNWGSHFLASRIEHERGVPEDNEIGNMSERAVLEKAIDQWPTPFRAFMESQNSNTPSVDRDSAVMCAAIHRGMKVLVHLAAGESAVEVNGDINDILDMVAAIIDNQDIDTKSPHRGFGFETGLISVLWLLMMNAQDPAMRARALRLMKMWPRREGIWDGARMSTVVEKVQNFAQSSRFSADKPKERQGSSADNPGILYMDGFSKILGVLDGKRRMQSERGAKSPEIKPDGADYPV